LGGHRKEGSDPGIGRPDRDSVRKIYKPLGFVIFTHDVVVGMQHNRIRRIATVAIAILTIVSTAGPAVAVTGGDGASATPAGAGPAADTGSGGIAYADLDITPSPANVSEPVTVAATVENRGNEVRP